MLLRFTMMSDSEREDIENPSPSTPALIKILASVGWYSESVDLIETLSLLLFDLMDVLDVSDMVLRSNESMSSSTETEAEFNEGSTVDGGDSNRSICVFLGTSSTPECDGVGRDCNIS
jgi:hypothetical protein